MEKNQYEKPYMEVIYIDGEDIIRTSADNETPPISGSEMFNGGF